MSHRRKYGIPHSDVRNPPPPKKTIQRLQALHNCKTLYKIKPLNSLNKTAETY